MDEEKRIEKISIDKIIPNIYQPRIKFDEKSIKDLSKSIQNHGIIQPLIVRKIGEKYEIIDGERRYKASKKIGLEKLPTIILNVDEKEAAEIILMENMQKQLLTPIEEANAYQQIMLLNRFDLDDLAEKINKEKIYIENKLKLLTLHPEIQEALLDNKISEGHAKILTRVKNREKQLDLFNKIIKERITVKNLEELISNENIIPFNKKEKNKMEENEMDNSQLNFNQYNNLLKEQEKPQMEVNSAPEAILGNVIPGVKPNDFFPSLEEQPLNIEVPVGENQEVTHPVQMPQFEVPSAPMPEVAPVGPMMTPAVEMAPNPLPEMASPVQMPQFEAPSAPMPEFAPVGQMMTPAMEMAPNPLPEMASPVQMPQFEVPSAQMPEFSPVGPMMTPAMEMAPNPLPEMATPVQMPQFEVPSAPMPEVAPVGPMMEPSMEMAPNPLPEMASPVQMPQFEVPSAPMPEFAPVGQMMEPSMEMAPNPLPEMTTPVQMPQFEVPSAPIPEFAPVGPMMTPSMEMVKEPTLVSEKEQVSTKDLKPAINIIKNLMPLLQNSGYNVIIEERDVPEEYLVTIKIAK